MIDNVLILIQSKVINHLNIGLIKFIIKENLALPIKYMVVKKVASPNGKEVKCFKSF